MKSIYRYLFTAMKLKYMLLILGQKPHADLKECIEKYSHCFTKIAKMPLRCSLQIQVTYRTHPVGIVLIVKLFKASATSK